MGNKMNKIITKVDKLITKEIGEYYVLINGKLYTLDYTRKLKPVKKELKV